jgi:hypothetical protein
MNNVDINFEKLADLVASKEEQEKMKYISNQYLETEKDVLDINIDDVEEKKNDVSNGKDLKKLMNTYEKSFMESEKKYLWKMFLTYSSDNVYISIKPYDRL